MYRLIKERRRGGKNEHANWWNKKIQMETLITIRRVLCHNRYTSPALPTTWCIERLQKHSPMNLEPRKSRWASRRPPASPWSRPPMINLPGSRLDIAYRFGSGQFPRCTLETFWWTAWGFIFDSFGKEVLLTRLRWRNWRRLVFWTRLILMNEISFLSEIMWSVSKFKRSNRNNSCFFNLYQIMCVYQR